MISLVTLYFTGPLILYKFPGNVLCNFLARLIFRAFYRKVVVEFSKKLLEKQEKF